MDFFFPPSSAFQTPIEGGEKKGEEAFDPGIASNEAVTHLPGSLFPFFSHAEDRRIDLLRPDRPAHSLPTV